MRIRGPDETDSSSQMKFTDEELLQIIEDVTVALGQILLTHRELTEGLVDQQSELSQRKIDGLKKRIDLEKSRLVKLKRLRRRKTELEKLRQDRLKKSQGKTAMSS